MRRTPQPSTPRLGFTLIELLVVILIVGILIALLVPAIAAAVRTAQDARVSSEIANLQTALADFKNKYGEYPPSRIILQNSGYYNPTDNTIIPGAPSDLTFGALNLRTARAMQKYFPRANYFFNTSNAGAQLNWNQMGHYTTNDYVILQGHECLVFFLGGMPQYTNGTISCAGWSKDPKNPFDTVNPNTVVSPNRTQPLFEFAPGRLQDIFSMQIGSSSPALAPSADGTASDTPNPPPVFSNPNGFQNGYPSYVDPLSNTTAPRPYTYFSSYGNGAYDPNDDNSGGLGTSGDSSGQELDDNLQFLIYRLYGVNFPPASVGSYGPNPYTNSDPGTTGVTWVNPQSFQLFSAGRDGLWGIGGIYSPNTTGSKLPITANDTPPTGANVFPKTEALSLRTREKDNITNFSGGKLD